MAHDLITTRFPQQPGCSTVPVVHSEVAMVSMLQKVQQIHRNIVHRSHDKEDAKHLVLLVTLDSILSLEAVLHNRSHWQL